MSRIVWKGAISFGLVHVPIVVYPGSRPARLNFDWIDKRDHAPVGYQRINKRTGKVIDSENIVKGYEYEKGEYVFMSDADFDNANVGATQTIELLDFVAAQDVPLYYFDTPYYLAPDKRGDKGYALLRDALVKSKRIGLANVVLHTRQHLAAVMPLGDVLVMMTMRFANEIRPVSELEVPAKKRGKDAPSAAEVDMAMRLVDSMTRDFEPERYTDGYREDLLKSIKKKIKAGKTHELTEEQAPAPVRESAKVIDLMAVLKRSIEGRGAPGGAKQVDVAQDESESRPKAKSKSSKSGSVKSVSTKSESPKSASTKSASTKSASPRSASAKAVKSKSTASKSNASTSVAGKASKKAATGKPARSSQATQKKAA